MAWYLYNPSTTTRVSDYYESLAELQLQEGWCEGLLVKYRCGDQSPPLRREDRPEMQPIRGKPKQPTSMTAKEYRELSELATKQIFRETIPLNNELIAKRDKQSGLSAIFDYLDRQAALENR